VPAVTEVSFSLMGPLDIRCRGQAIAIPGARQRSLLAALLLRANQPVAKHALCAAVWAGKAPAGAEDTLRSYVMRLRRVLGPALAGRLVLRPPGYLLRLDAEDELDLLRFRGCLTRGKSAAAGGDWERSLREFSEGLSLWRGEPLCDVPSDTLQLSVMPALTELRTQVWEGLAAAALRLGRAPDLVVGLQRLTEEDPLSERFSALLMSALCQCGRRVDALAEFRRLRGALIAEHGVEPGTAVRELHQRLLAEEGAGAEGTAGVPPGTAPAARRATGPPGTGPGVPRQLPRGAAVFTGREGEVRDLAGELAVTQDGHGAGAVAAITGFPGIGKTELAIQVAHRVAAGYPDGQLFADLRGSRADPATPGQLAGQVLRALGVPRAAVAEDEAERLSQYRTLLAARRMLVLLDDARDADQVRPLIPGSESCGTLVTARGCLAHLPEARSRVLAELTDADAAALLGILAGPERVCGEPAAVASIVAACGGVPLALSIAGARLVARPGWPAGYLARLLADERRRLDELTFGGRSVRESLESAYRTLDGPGSRAQGSAARAWRQLGRWQCASITAAQGACLFRQPLTDATAALESLVDAGLLASPGPASYRLPGLMRVFAAECARRPPGHPAGRGRSSRSARPAGR
jgi:DNA-binding SARP family transcriptional activator